MQSMHLDMRAGTATSGEPVFETVPVLPLTNDRYRIVGTPALVEGCAADDVIEVDAGGQFRVVERGGNVAIHVYSPNRTVSADQVDELRRAFIDSGGLVEAPSDRRFLVVTISVAVGFPRIESIMNGWSAATRNAWSYGNVYDSSGLALNWW